MPIGLRGVGKTVLLNRFAKIADIEGYQVGFIEAPESGDFSTLLAGHLRKILLTFDITKKTAKLLKALRVLKTFSLQLPDGSRVSIDVDALPGSADSGNLSDDLTDLLLAAGEAAVEHGKALVESKLSSSPQARDQLLETALELESKTVAAIDECEGG